MNITWTCHICNDERPDEAISVVTKPVPGTNGLAEQNIRYCNDRPECHQGALDKAPINLRRDR